MWCSSAPQILFFIPHPLFCRNMSWLRLQVREALFLQQTWPPQQHILHTKDPRPEKTWNQSKYAETHSHRPARTAATVYVRASLPVCVFTCCFLPKKGLLSVPAYFHESIFRRDPARWVLFSESFQECARSFLFRHWCFLGTRVPFLPGEFPGLWFPLNTGGWFTAEIEQRTFSSHRGNRRTEHFN